MAVDSGDDADVSMLSLTFCLVACAQLALAERDAGRAATALGAAHGLRRRAGLRAWPSTRRSEAELVTRVVQELDAEAYEAAFTAGAELGHREAIAFVRRP